MSILGVIGGRGFATYTSGRQCKWVLKRHGIKVHGMHMNKGRYVFFVRRCDAERAAQILESQGIDVGEWD